MNEPGYSSVVGYVMFGFVGVAAITTLPKLIMSTVRVTGDMVADTDPPEAPVGPTVPAQPSTDSSHVDWTWVLTVLVVVAIVAATAVAIFIAWRAIARYRRHVTARRATRTAADELWNEAQRICDDVLSCVAAWEFDPQERYFNRPLLADSGEQLTADWWEAHAAMMAALPERRPADCKKARAAVVAAEHAREAWEKAWHYAGNIGLGTLPGHDRRRMQQAQKILAQSADQATTDAERAVCIDRVVAILAEVTAVDRSAIRRSVTTYVSEQVALAAPALPAAICAQFTLPGS